VDLQGHLISGLASLKKAAELYVVSWLLGLIAVAFLPIAFFIAALTTVAALLRLITLAHVALILIPFLAAAILWLLATFAFLVPGIGRLAKWSDVFETPVKLVRWGCWGALVSGALALLAGVASLGPLIRGVMTPQAPWLIAGFFAAIALAVLAGIACLTGFTGLVVAFFELSSQTRVGDFKVAAVLLILGLALGAASLMPSVSWAMTTDGEVAERVVTMRLENVLLAVAAGAASIAGWVFARDAAERALRAPLAPSPPPPSA